MLTPWMGFDRAFGGVSDLRRRLDDAFFDAPFGAVLSSAAFDAFPRTTFRDAGDDLVISLEAPGFVEADLRVDVNRELVTVSGERRNDPPEGYRSHVRERGTLAFTRSYALPLPVKSEEVRAALKDGVLTITLPKLPEVKPRSITINAH